MSDRGMRPDLQLSPDEPDQVPRLEAFREQHPEVGVGWADGMWQARVTAYRLKDLLDTLDELTGGQEGGQ